MGILPMPCRAIPRRRAGKLRPCRRSVSATDETRATHTGKMPVLRITPSWNNQGRIPLDWLHTAPLKNKTSASTQANMTAPGTIQSCRHWNRPSTRYLSITIPANWVPRNKPTPL